MQYLVNKPAIYDGHQYDVGDLVDGDVIRNAGHELIARGYLTPLSEQALSNIAGRASGDTPQHNRRADQTNHSATLGKTDAQLRAEGLDHLADATDDDLREEDGADMAPPPDREREAPEAQGEPEHPAATAEEAPHNDKAPAPRKRSRT